MDERGYRCAERADSGLTGTAELGAFDKNALLGRKLLHQLGRRSGVVSELRATAGNH